MCCMSFNVDHSYTFQKEEENNGIAPYIPTVVDETNNLLAPGIV